jgi:hypothetical protein
MLVPIERWSRAYDTVVHIPFIMKYCPASRPTAYQFDAKFLIAKNPQIDLNPWVLIPPNHYARPIRVEEEDSGVCGRFLEQIMLD